MEKKWKIEKRDGYNLIVNHGGKVLGISENSSVPIVEQDGFAFKNLSKSGKLEPFEDWRCSVSERAKDLAHKLNIRQIAGLMLYSGHQMVPSVTEGLGKHFISHYGGKSFEESGAMPWDMTDEQKEFLEKDGVRHILVMGLKDAITAARWHNRLQAYVENLDFGIPVNNSSDPRHGINKDAEYNGGGCERLSKWANGIGFAATFSKELVYEFGKAAAAEYRALGITTALSPQIDLSTEPRWMRFCDTFGEHTQLTTELTKAYCDGFQTSFGAQEVEGGWGYESVNTMVKHFPGGGTCESGRDSHYSYGKFGVYPGNNFEEHLKPFENGAFRLDGPTGFASAIMPYYSVPYAQDAKYHENVGNSYSKYIIQDLLRGKYGYEGVVCTDWDITGDCGEAMEEFKSRCWGVEDLSVTERHLKIIMNGVDQFGGNQAIEPILAAYALGCERYGADVMDSRFEQSAVRLLTNIFRLGLFENPYLDEMESAHTVGKKEYVEMGFLSQLKSIVMLKNKRHVLPLKKGIKVFVPIQHRNPYPDFFSCMTQEETKHAINPSALAPFFTVVDAPEDADVAICFMDSPISCGYSTEDKANGGNGYVPVTLQYRPYTAKNARSISIAGGHPLEDSSNRSYRGKSNTAANESDLDNLLDMRRRMGDKPVVAVLTMKNPTVMNEFEPFTDAILVEFGVSREAILKVLTGGFEPEGLLPLQIPANMETVEQQQEDVPFDMQCHVDEEGNVYDFSFGLNFKGMIYDQRVKQYGIPKKALIVSTTPRKEANSAVLADSLIKGSNDIYVYHLPLSGQNPSNYFHELLHILPAKEQDYVLHYRYEADRILSLYGKLLIRMGINSIAHTPLDQLQFSTSEHGKPYLVHPHGCHFNLSHTKNYLICCFSTSDSVGADVECIAAPPYEIMDTCFHKAEQRYIDTAPLALKSQYFYEMWTRKEAYLKQSGCGMVDHLNKLNTLELSDAFYSYVVDGFMCSICTPSSKNIQKIFLTPDTVHDFFSPSVS